MEEKEVLLTQEGYDNLEKELNYLRTEKTADQNFFALLEEKFAEWSAK